MSLTPQQQAVIETEGRALLVEAGAGTGKTFALVERFLYLLERYPDWPIDSIVAVTFTEKATREMRSRIRAAVEKRAADAPDDAGWQARRRELDRLAVSTIHGLCARILRENAIAAGIDPRFEVLEETDTTLLREEAVRQVLAELGAGVRVPAPGRRDPLELLRSFEVNDLREQMLRLLSQRGSAERLFTHLGDPAALMAKWGRKVGEMQSAIWRDWASLTTGTSWQCMSGARRMDASAPRAETSAARRWPSAASRSTAAAPAHGAATKAWPKSRSGSRPSAN
jgi:hypothetical protein